MTQLQLLGLLSITLLALNPSRGNPISGQCVEQTLCTTSLEEYHAQIINMPNSLNERSVAAWSYVEKIDLDRVPQVIYEANCLTTHSCKGVDSTSSLETIPLSLRMPVLRKNPRCLTYSLEFEDVNIACICATSRQS